MPAGQNQKCCPTNFCFHIALPKGRAAQWRTQKWKQTDTSLARTTDNWKVETTDKSVAKQTDQKCCSTNVSLPAQWTTEKLKQPIQMLQNKRINSVARQTYLFTVHCEHQEQHNGEIKSWNKRIKSVARQTFLFTLHYEKGNKGSSALQTNGSIVLPAKRFFSHCTAKRETKDSQQWKQTDRRQIQMKTCSNKFSAQDKQLSSYWQRYLTLRLSSAMFDHLSPSVVQWQLSSASFTLTVYRLP